MQRFTSILEYLDIPMRRYSVAATLIVVCSALLLVGLANVAVAQNLGDLMITPTRIVFEGNKKNENITLLNTGSDTATYAISFIQYRMTDEGAFQEITEPESNQNFADKLVRFFPKQVTLAPKEAQTIRAQCIKLQGLTDGEYRSHLYFRGIPKPRAMESTAQDTSTSLGVRLTAIYGVSIPVIIRQGKLQVKATLDSVRIVSDPEQPDLRAIKMRLRRTGNISLYGDVTITMVTGGKSIPIGEGKGIALYTPTESRSVHVPIVIPEKQKLEKCTIVVEYRNRSDLQPMTATAKLIIP